MELNVMKNRYYYYAITGALSIISIFVLIFGKMNFGIDMTGGIQAEYSYKNSINIENLREALKTESKILIHNGKEVINTAEVYKVTGEDKINITTGFDSSIEFTKLEEFKKTYRKQVLEILKKEDLSIQETSYTNIGKSFGDYIKSTAITTLIIAILAIAFYVTWAFSGIASGISIFSFSWITIVTLLHDVLGATGLYLITSMFLPEFKVDTFFITALLTILGYSINDTIVVFDRIRENIKTMIGKKDLGKIIDISISDTLRRSIFTSLTVFFVLLTTLFFGPETIKGFILVMLYGTIIGTYSSIFIASPLLYDFNKNKIITNIKEKKIEDKIVV